MIRVQRVFERIDVPEHKSSSCAVSKHLRGSEGDFSHQNFITVFFCKNVEKVQKIISCFLTCLGPW